MGKEISTLINERFNAGTYETQWNGNGYPSGIFFYRMETFNPEGSGQVYSETKKMTLIKSIYKK